MRVVAHNGAQIWGGAERATVALLAGLARRGHDVHLLCNSELVRAGASTLGVRASILVVGGDLSFVDSLRLASALKRERPDVFLISTYKKLFLTSLAARIARVPRTLARVGLESDNPRSWKYRFALQHWVSGVAVNAMRMAKSFETSAFSHLLQVVVIPNGVNSVAPTRSPAQVRKEFGIPPHVPIVGTLARLAKQKRIDRLIDAADWLPENVHVLIAGDGVYRDSLAMRARERKAANRIHFAGNRDDTGDILNALDIFVVSSDQEGLSNAMLEAMSCGVPVVSTDVSGADDALIAGDPDQIAGVITPFSAEKLAAGIGGLLADSALRRTMGANARKRAQTMFSFELMLDRWEEFLAPAQTPAER